MGSTSKVRSKENVKKAISALSGTGGLALIAVCLGQLLNPGAWALANDGSRISIQDAPVNDGREGLQNGGPQLLLKKRFSNQELAAACVLMLRVAHIDGNMDEVERSVIEKYTDGVENGSADHAITHIEALDLIKTLETDKKREIISWCYSVAKSDGVFHPDEQAELKRYCDQLGLDCEADHGLPPLPEKTPWEVMKTAGRKFATESGGLFKKTFRGNRRQRP
ncbi:MAG: TerB family tellurite resistance protein [Magnetococcales bacterium]|nr:TerB family tellurite resistance protein [Magnetococcales bacterium]